MKINYKFWLGIFVLVGAVVVSYALVVRAASPAGIVFPVAELGNCQNEAECKIYCDKTENITACVSFAERYNLISSEEAAQAKKFAQIGVGPGGCASKNSCESYCNDVSHMDECLAFAEKNDLMPAGKLKEARQVQAALAKGAKMPGSCRNKNECDAYCENPDNMEECITFGEAAGFIPPEELVQAKKVLEVIKTKGVKPPPCRGQEACDAYCVDHFEECMAFAEAAGFVSPEDAVMARKTGGKGPGDCKNKEECDAFCQNPDNQETCFSFAKEHGLISEDDLRRMEEGKQQMTEGLNQAPPQVFECINAVVGSDMIEKMKSGTAMPSQKIGEAMRGCFEKNMGQMGPQQGQQQGLPQGFENGMMPGTQQPTVEFQPPAGFVPPEGSQFSPEQIEQQFQLQEGIPPSMEQIQQFQQKMEQQMPQQFQKQMMPPAEKMAPPPPPGEMSPPPPAKPLPPSSYRGSFFSNLLKVIELLIVE